MSRSLRGRCALRVFAGQNSIGPRQTQEPVSMLTGSREKSGLTCHQVRSSVCHRRPPCAVRRRTSSRRWAPGIARGSGRCPRRGGHGSGRSCSSAPSKLLEQVDLDIRNRDDFLAPTLNDPRAEGVPGSGVERLQRFLAPVRNEECEVQEDTGTLENLDFLPALSEIQIPRSSAFSGRT